MSLELIQQQRRTHTARKNFIAKEQYSQVNNRTVDQMFETDPLFFGPSIKAVKISGVDTTGKSWSTFGIVTKDYLVKLAAGSFEVLKKCIQTKDFNPFLDMSFKHYASKYRPEGVVRLVAAGANSTVETFDSVEGMETEVKELSADEIAKMAEQGAAPEMAGA